MWDKVLRAFKDALAETEAQYMTKATSMLFCRLNTSGLCLSQASIVPTMKTLPH